jgi:hypothetical protein
VVDLVEQKKNTGGNDEKMEDSGEMEFVVLRDGAVLARGDQRGMRPIRAVDEEVGTAGAAQQEPQGRSRHVAGQGREDPATGKTEHDAHGEFDDACA